MKKKLYCFDFDGTLTTSDTLLEFIRYAKGTSRFLMVFLMYSPLLVLMKLHLFPNWKAKQLIFAHLFAGMRIEKFDADGGRVLGTQIEVIDGRLTGKFKSNNCYGEEKVHRICEALTTTTANAYGTPSLSFDRAQYDIEAFGDSRGDKEMLAYADKGHYKPFRI